MADTIDKELQGLKGDQKMSELAVKSSQSQMAQMLKGEMGNDMMAVLNGEKKIEINKKEERKFKIKSWFKNLLMKF